MAGSWVPDGDLRTLDLNQNYERPHAFLSFIRSWSKAGFESKKQSRMKAVRVVMTAVTAAAKAPKWPSKPPKEGQ